MTTKKVEVGFLEIQNEGKPWYVSDGLNNNDSYIRDDLSGHSYMGNFGGTYFETKEEAQALCDKYNNKTFGITIKEDHYYITEDGTKVGPAKYLGGGSVCWNISKEDLFLGYYDNGEICIDWPVMNIVGEWPCDDPKEDNTEVTVGLTYECVNGREFTCIYVEGNHAWMKQVEGDESPAYVWDKNTGATVSLSVDTGYNLKRSFVVV